MLSCTRNEQDRVWHSGLCAFVGTAHARGPWGQGHKSDMEPALKEKHIDMHGVPHACIYTGAGNTEVRTRGGAGRWGGGGCTRGRDAGQRHEHRRGKRCQSLSLFEDLSRFVLLRFKEMNMTLRNCPSRPLLTPSLLDHVFQLKLLPPPAPKVHI